METRERWLSEQPVAVLQAHAQECGINTSGCREKRELVEQILRNEPPELSRPGQHSSSPHPAPRPPAEVDFDADERLARQLQAEDDADAQRVRAALRRDPAASALPMLAQALGEGHGRQTNERLAQAIESIIRPRSGPGGGQARHLSGSSEEGGARNHDAFAQLLGSLGSPAVSRSPSGASLTQPRRASADRARDAHALSGAGPAEDVATQALARVISEVLDTRGGGAAGGNAGAHMLAEFLGSLITPQGMDEATINSRTTTMTYNETPGRDSSASDDERKCMVCLETFKVGDDLRILPCLHRYHRQCVDPWLAQNCHCPICKHDVTE
mmetsp:Transcript_23248/g.65023  ORF Transcript_23248/g.65023 Transcript_23248/m.65023 type:complete len:328 (+) Transcript_23248:51-1034(+)